MDFESRQGERARFVQQVFKELDTLQDFKDLEYIHNSRLPAGFMSRCTVGSASDSFAVFGRSSEGCSGH